MPKVSVILPCYNVGEYIERCLLSLVNQTLTDIEIICVNDKSTDNTWDIITQYSDKDKRIVAIDLPQNSGAAVARNAGLKIASGEYIGFVDPDDYVELNFFESLYNRAVQTNAHVTKGNVKMHIADQICVPELHNKVKQDITNFSSSFWSAIYKRDFLLKHNIRFPDEIRTSQDVVFLAHVILNVGVMSFVDDTFYHYFYQRPGSLDSPTLTHAKAQSKYNASLIILELIKNAHLDPLALQTFVKNHVVEHVMYNMSKKFENPDDEKQMFDLICDLYATYFNTRHGRKYFSHNQLSYIKNKDYKKYIRHKQLCGRRRYCLFGFIPLIRIDKYSDATFVFFSEFIPLFKISNKRIYLFNIVLLLKIKE